MSSHQRRLHLNSIAHHLEWIAIPLACLTTRQEEVGIPWRHRRYVLHRAYSDGVQIQDRVPDHVVGCRLLRQSDHDSMWPDDSNLLPGDFSYRVAQKLLVVEGNISNYADNRLNHVRGVEAPSHSHFKNCDVYLLAGEMRKSNRCHHLEKTRMPRQFPPLDKPACDLVHFAVETGKLIVADLLAVHPNPFVNADQVRGGVESGFQSRCAQN